MSVPMVIVYRVSALSYFLAKKLAPGVKDVGLVNIVAGGRIVPELIQDQATAQNLADALSPVLSDPSNHARVRGELEKVKALLGAGGASARAAGVVLELMKSSG